ncbi:MAG: hypothetical protein ACNYNY_06575 [Candidatus Oxydemutatoraceae bacterium WSBS_2016_MAG_OTU14]
MWWRSSVLAIQGDQCTFLAQTKALSAWTGTLHDLPVYIQQAGFQGISCSLVLPINECVIKTVELDASYRFALRRMVRQHTLWEEYCGIDFTQFVCRWSILPSSDSRLMPVLLGAVPRRVLAHYQSVVQRAGLKAKKFSLQCFDMSVLTQDESPHLNHAVVVLDSASSYVMAKGYARYDLHELTAMPSKIALIEQDSSESNPKPNAEYAVNTPVWAQFLDQLAAAVQSLFFQATTQTDSNEQISVTIVHSLQKATSQTLTQALKLLFPNEFAIKVVATHELLKHDDLKVPISLDKVLAFHRLHSKRGHSVSLNFLPSQPLYKRRAVRYAQWSMLAFSVIVLIVGLTRHYEIAQNRHVISPRLHEYYDLLASLRDKQVHLEHVQTKLQHYADVFAFIDAKRAKQSQVIEFLKFFAIVTPAETFIDQLEFITPQHFRIQGYVQSEELLAHYADKLRARDECAQLQIKDIKTSEQVALKSFVVDCGERIWLADHELVQ